MSFYGVKYVENGIIGVITETQIVKKSGNVWVVKTGKSRNAKTYAVNPLGDGPHASRATALNKAMEESDLGGVTMDVGPPRKKARVTQQQAMTSAQSLELDNSQSLINAYSTSLHQQPMTSTQCLELDNSQSQACSTCLSLRHQVEIVEESNRSLKEENARLKGQLRKHTDVDILLQRLEKIVDQQGQQQHLQPQPSKQRDTLQERKCKGFLFSNKCLEDIKLLPKSPDNIPKAVRKAIRDLFSERELAHGTATGTETRPALDRARMKAAKKFVKKKLNLDSLRWPAFNSIVRLITNEVRVKWRKAGKLFDEENHDGQEKEDKRANEEDEETEENAEGDKENRKHIIDEGQDSDEESDEEEEAAETDLGDNSLTKKLRHFFA